MYELLDLPLPKEVISNNELDTCILELLKSHGNNEDVIDRVDMILFNLYGLSYDEVLIVDPSTCITREEYDNFKID